jgi:hypothetical protein
MKRHRWVDWAIALVMIVSLFGPTVSGAMAQDDEVDDPSAVVVETIEEGISEEGGTPPDEGAPIPEPGEGTSEPPDEGVVVEPADPLPADGVVDGGVEDAAPPDTGLMPAAQEGEEVEVAAIASFSIFANVDGAVFQVLAYSGGACGAVVDGPETVSGGSATFSVDDAGTYCIELVSPPPGYALASNSIGHFPGGIMANKTFAELQAGWSVEFALLPTANITVYKEDSVSGALLAGAEFAIYDATCTTLIAGPAAVGTNAADGSLGRVIFDGATHGLYVGETYCIVETTTPPGYVGGENVVKELPEGGLEWTILNDPLYDLPIFKEDLSGNLIDGAGFTLYDASGTTVVRAEQFVGDASAQDGSAGRTIFEDLPAGQYLVVETTVPDGYQGADAQLVSLPENTSGWTFKNTPLYDLPIFKEDDAGNLIGGAGFTLYDATGATVIRSQQFVADATAENLANGSAGRTIFEDLPAGDYLVVETTVPANHDGAGPFLVSLPENESGWTFVNDRNTGTLLIVKRFCEVFDPNDAGTVFGGPVAADATECDFGAASFLIYPFQGTEALGPFTTDPVTGEAEIPDLPVGTHGIKEISTSATSTFTIAEDQTTVLQVRNDVYNSGSLQVIKYFCKARHEKTVIEVTYPVETAGRHEGKDEQCWTGKAHFEVWLFGNEEDAIRFHTGWHEGIAWLTLPLTDSSTGPHVLVELETGATAEFEIAKGEMTSIVVTNFVKKDRPDKPDKPEPPVVPEEDEIATVDTLPATGTGITDQTAAMFLAMGGTMLLALGALEARRKLLR